MQWFNLEDNVNLLALIGALAIFALTAFVTGKYVKQMKIAKEGGELDEYVWDGIGEYKNPLPLGWAIVYALVIVWALWYMLAGYPLNSYSQIGEYNEEVAAANAKFEKRFANPDIKTLHAMGESVFLVQCSACHGITGDGIGGKAADLALWGSEEGIVDAILKGSKGLDYPMGEMPAGMADEEGAKAIAAYIAKEISGIKKTKNENLVASGKELFAACAACHGEDGKGMEGMSPDLSKYGTASFVEDVLQRGKKGDIGAMPKFNDGRLNALQQKAVGEYVISLSKGE
ncbi:cytochrome c oxidase, cbb3-type, subunit III [Campylobacter rectus RM3267]|uniref:Cytochrome c oxidase subunit III n=2 Tax=Campylobacter rectus TaxID=203 RepID=A0A6G5QKR3_CAMRE|nr:c-type cytochrome [Campylobacter rectus]EEF14729.1 cytochrome c oxidase, cbb3-type, subunit III [Campylobacter rectus RM3267]QCD46066.1 cytochrome c oxidase CcoNOPQ, cbb3-type, membrane-bound monoheme cytochrome c subunit III [Campylobacter rectus]UEB46780.1 c-type cytochrome [Campylobacter rectus]